MIDFAILQFWLVCINSVGVALLTLCFIRVADRKLALRFILVVVAGLLYCNSLLLFWGPGFSLETRFILSRGVFAFVSLLSNAFVLFVIQFCRVSGEYKGARFVLFELSVLIIVGLAIAGLLPAGVYESEGRFLLRQGDPHLFFVIATICHVAYIVFLARKGYRSTQEETLQFQIRYLIGAGAATAILMVITNSILPYVRGDSSFAPFATLELMLFWAASLYMLIQGDVMILRRDLSHLLKVKAMRDQDSVFALRTIFQAMDHVIASGNPVDEIIRVRTASGDLRPLRFSGIAKPERPDGLVPLGWYEGQFDELSRLRAENFRLTLAVEQGRILHLQSNSGEMLESGVMDDRESETQPMAIESDLLPLERAERRVIVEFLEKNSYNQRRTSQEIGIRPNTLSAKMRKYNIQPPARSRPGRKPGSRYPKDRGHSLQSRPPETV